MTSRRAALSIALVSVAATAALAEVARPTQQPAAGARAPMPLRPPTQPPVIARPVPAAAPETAVQAKLVAGTWSCKGTTMHEDGSSTPVVAALGAKVDLEGGWLQTTLVEGPLVQFTEYRSFDGVAKQWTRLQLTATSGMAMTTSIGELNGTWTWLGTEQTSAGTVQIRDMESLSSNTWKRWGEAMLGGAWQKRYEVTCTR